MAEKPENNPKLQPALIKGIRRSGKTHTVLLFENSNYRQVIFLNFMIDPSLNCVFQGSLKVNDLLPLLSARFPKSIFEEG